MSKARFPVKTIRMSKTNVRKPWQSGQYTVYLWEFLYGLLQDPECRSLITWTNQDTKEFRIKNVKEIATLWGTVKNRPTMDDKKLLRALRYYYKTKILRKVKGQKGAYQFLSIPYEMDKNENDNELKDTGPTTVGQILPSGVTSSNYEHTATNDFKTAEHDCLRVPGTGEINFPEEFVLSPNQTETTNVSCTGRAESSSESTVSSNESSSKYLEEIEEDLMDICIFNPTKGNMEFD